MTPLHGLRVLVTRPAAQAAALCQLLAEAGAEAVSLPLIAIEAVQDATAFDALAACLDDYAIAFFVSPNAVEHGVAALRARRAWPATLAVACVGPGSRKALQAQGFARVICPESGFDSEAVLALPEFAADAVAGRRILVLRGDGGRELLADTLRARGATVDCVSVYRRVLPALQSGELDAALTDLGAISLTSSESLANLQLLAGAARLQRILAVPVYCPHPRIAAAARQAGFTQVRACAPGDDGLMAALRAGLPRPAADGGSAGSSPLG